MKIHHATVSLTRYEMVATFPPTSDDHCSAATILTRLVRFRERAADRGVAGIGWVGLVPCAREPRDLGNSKVVRWNGHLFNVAHIARVNAWGYQVSK